MTQKYVGPPFSDVHTDPQERYRAGFQHGAQKVREMIEAGTVDLEKLIKWIEIDLQKWRHSPEDHYNPPVLK